MKKLQFKERLIFLVLTLVSVHVFFNALLTYQIQETSQQQTVALLLILVKLVCIGAAFFLFFKFSKMVFEDIPRYLLNNQDSKNVWISIVFGVLLVVTLAQTYGMYNEWKQEQRAEAWKNLMETLEERRW